MGRQAVQPAAFPQSLSPGKDWGDLRPAGTLGEKETLPSGLRARLLPGRQRLWYSSFWAFLGFRVGLQWQTRLLTPLGRCRRVLSTLVVVGIPGVEVLLS